MRLWLAAKSKSCSKS